MLPPTWVDAWTNQRRPKAGSRRIETARIVVTGRSLPGSGLRHQPESRSQRSFRDQPPVAVVTRPAGGRAGRGPDQGTGGRGSAERRVGARLTVNREVGESALPSSDEARARGGAVEVACP